MTVAGDPSAVPTGPSNDDDLFSSIYAKYWRLVRYVLWRQLDQGQGDLADDLAQETFMVFWSSYIVTGKLTDPERPKALLMTIAQHRLSEHFSRTSSREAKVDFTDPADAVARSVRHTYALGSPHLAGLARELDGAMERMTEASKAWRDKHQEVYRLTIQLRPDHLSDRGGLLPETRERFQQALADGETEAGQLLEDFRQACQTVGALRAEMESKAGPNWRCGAAQAAPSQAAGMAKQPKAGLIRNDSSVTHCPEGHFLDLANVHFLADGSRLCRRCRFEYFRAGRQEHKQPESTEPNRASLYEQKVDAARVLLTDPDHDHLEFQQIAKQAGISVEALRRRLPATADERQKRRLARPAHVRNPKLGKARELLADDAHEMTVAQIAEAAGLSFPTLYKALPKEIAARTERRAQADAAAEATVRAMLADPDNRGMTAAQIAASVGWSQAKLSRRVPDNQDLRPAVDITGQIEQARRLVTDPDCTLSLAAIAKAVGLTRYQLDKHLEADLAARPSRREIDPDILAAARQMITDPDNGMTLEAIGQAVGCRTITLRRHLRAEVAERRARVAAARSLTGSAR